MADRVDPELVGAWRRTSLSIEGAQPFEDSDVIWIQSANRYVDLRRPHDGATSGPEVFGGAIDWDRPQLTFHHDLDRSGSFPSDAGDLSWDGPVLVERGVIDVGDSSIHYEERWERLTVEGTACEVVECRAGGGALTRLAIRCGDHAVVIDRDDSIDPGQAVAGCYFRRDVPGRWEPAWTVGGSVRWPFTDDMA